MSYKILDFLRRNAYPIILITLVVILLKLDNAVVNTVLMLIGLEVIAIFLSAIASYAYTELDFTKDDPRVLGYIFLGVHLLIGLGVVGVYIANFAN